MIERFQVGKGGLPPLNQLYPDPRKRSTTERERSDRFQLTEPPMLVQSVASLPFCSWIAPGTNFRLQATLPYLKSF